MIAIAYYLLKVLICSAVLFVYYQLALRNKLFHQWNRYYLLLMVMSSLLIPCFEFTFLSSPITQEPIPVLTAVHYADAYVAVASSQKQYSLSLEQTSYLLYATVCLAFLFLFFAGLRRIYALIRYHQVQSYQSIKLVITDAKGTPFSFLNYIFLSPGININSETGQQILQHEMVHVKEKHTIDKIFMQVVLSLFWWNPVFWLVRHELKMIHEFIADRKAVGQSDHAAFAAMILQSAYPQYNFNNFTNQFFQSSIKRRLIMLTKKNNRRLSYASRVLALPLIVILAFAFTAKTKKMLPQQLSVKTESIKTIEVKPDVIKTKLSTTSAPAFKADTIPEKTKGTKYEIGNALMVVDGAEKGRVNSIKEVEAFLSNVSVAFITILKDSAAIKKYGEKGKDGVIEIISKQPVGSAKDLLEKIQVTADEIIVFRDNEKSKEALIVIDGKVMGLMKDMKPGAMPKPNEVGEISVYKGKKATEKYGDQAKEGAIEIKTKKVAPTSNAEKSNKPMK